MDLDISSIKSTSITPKNTCFSRNFQEMCTIFYKRNTLLKKFLVIINNVLIFSCFFHKFVL